MAESTATQTKPVPEGYTVVREGQGEILSKGTNDVFYNKAQVVNRDISKAVVTWFIATLAAEAKQPKKFKKKRMRDIKEFIVATPTAEDKAVKGIRFLEGLAASGLRSIRFAKEIPGIGRIDASDLDATAAASMVVNVDHNGVGDIVKPVHRDARLLMLEKAGLYDAVDLDPYGTPCQLLDPAVQAVNEGGLLMVTATDMAVLCGNNGETCFAKYGSYPLHKPYCHEMAVRTLLATIETQASRYKRYIKPVVCMSIDFYVRVFVRVYTSAQEVKSAALRQSYIWQSLGCDAFWLQPVAAQTMRKNSLKFTPSRGPRLPPECPISGGGYSMGGPIFSAPIHDMEAVGAILRQVEGARGDYPAAKRIIALLTNVSEELPDCPLYYTLHDMAKTLKVTPPKADLMRSAVIHAGHRVSGSHANPQALKTSAPPEVLWDLMRCWAKTQPAKLPEPGSVREKIMSKKPEVQANFTLVGAAKSKAKQAKVPRFPANPDNWGPRPRAGRPNLPHEETAGAESTAPEREAGSEPAAHEKEAGPEPAAQETGTGPGEGGAAAPAAVGGGAEPAAAPVSSGHEAAREPAAKRAKVDELQPA